MKAGGKLRNRRVEGQLAMTRSIGDYFLKSKGVISEPTVSSEVIQATDRYLVIASDGIWDKI
jgi:serine/threonine protein phosphatase PrpC